MMKSDSSTNVTTIKQRITTTIQRRRRFDRRNSTVPSRLRFASLVRTTTTLLLLLLLLLQSLHQQQHYQSSNSMLVVQAATYSITLNAKDTDCYMFRVPKKPVTISGNFDCYEEGNDFVRNCRNIDVWIESVPFDEDGHQYHHHHDTASPYLWESNADNTGSEEIFHIPINQDPDATTDLKGKYQLCFESSSKNDDEVTKNEEDDKIPNAIQIGFHLRIEHRNGIHRTLPDNELGPDEQRALHVIDTVDTAVESWHHLLDHFDYMRNREAIQDQLMHQTSNKVMGWSVVEAMLVIAMAIAQVCYWKSFFEQRRYL